MCDRGRFNFEAVRADDRLGAPLVRGEGGLAPVSWDVAMTAAAQLVTDALGAGGPASIAVLGGARGTNEDAFAWARLADALDVPHRDAQLADGLPAELLQLPRATIDEAAAASTVVLLGPDLKEELPVLYLRLRHAAQQGRTRLIELGPVATGLTTLRLAQRARRGRRRRCHPDRPCPPRDRRPAAHRPGRRRRRSGQPRRVGRRRGVVPARRARRLPRGQGPPGAAAGQRRRSAAARSGAPRRRARRRGDPFRRRGGPSRPPGAARCRPDRRLPGHRPRPAGDRRCPAGARRGHVPHRVLRRRRRRAGGRGLRREVGHDDEPRGAGDRGRQEGVGRRDVAPGLDDRLRAGRAARSRRSRRRCSVRWRP